MKLFPGLPRPVDDETFSSWVYRCSIGRCSETFALEQLQKQPEWIWNGRFTVVQDPDFDFNTKLVINACDLLRIDITRVIRVFSPSDVRIVPWERRIVFCNECFRDDIRAGRLPAWRKRWCYTNAIHCTHHSIFLTRLKVNPSISKAWSGFTEVCNSSENLQRVIQIANLSRFAKVALRRVNCWLNSQSSSNKDEENLKRLFYALYCVFLQYPTRRSHGGVALGFFERKRNLVTADFLNFQESLMKGIEAASPLNRFGCYMLIVLLMDVLPSKMIQVFNHLITQNSENFPALDSLVQSIYFGNVNSDEYNMLCVHLGEFPREKLSLLDCFLSMQEARYKKSGVYSDTKIGSITPQARI